MSEITAYEAERHRRIAENKRRMAEMGLLEVRGRACALTSRQHQPTSPRQANPCARLARHALCTLQIRFQSERPA